jgi:hypothetical protein
MFFFFLDTPLDHLKPWLRYIFDRSDLDGTRAGCKLIVVPVHFDINFDANDGDDKGRCDGGLVASEYDTLGFAVRGHTLHPRVHLTPKPQWLRVCRNGPVRSLPAGEIRARI